MNTGLRFLTGVVFSAVSFTSMAVPAKAVLVDRESLERGISANAHALLKAESELAKSHDAKRIEELKRKILLLKNDTQLKEQNLQPYLLKARDWMNLPDEMRKKLVREAGLPADEIDLLTMYVMGHPSELDRPLQSILERESLQYRRAALNDS